MRRAGWWLAGGLLAALARMSAAQCPIGLTPLQVSGRVVEPSPGGPVPVACCTVVLARVPSIYVEVTTGGDGRFVADLCCGLTTAISVSTRCCGGGGSYTMTCGSPLDLGDIACTRAVDLGDVRHLHGTVVCRSGSLVEPVPDCAILVTPFAGGTGLASPLVVRTDARGEWSACLPCESAPGAHVEAQCCGASVHLTWPDLDGDGIPDCDTDAAVPTLSCNPCPVAPCADPLLMEVSGMVWCDGAPRVPCDSCVVRVEVPWAPAPVFTLDVVTDATGHYAACIPCPADLVGPAWMLSATLLSCGIPVGIATIDGSGCPPSVVMPDGVCAGGGACPGPTPCTPTGTRVHGRLTCVDPGPDLVPGTADDEDVAMPGCGVFVTPAGCGTPPMNTTTDALGDYETCVPCGCTSVDVTTSCCGATSTQSLPACPGDIVVDVACAACGPVAPCGTVSRVHGRVSCIDPGADGLPGTGDDVVIALAGCDLTLTPSGCASAPIAVTTDGMGDYEACVPCGCTSVDVTASCCGTTSTHALPACPGDLVADIACGSCEPVAPCATGTRVHGRVSCLDPGADRLPGTSDDVVVALAGCNLTLTPSGCASAPIAVTTDALGDYEACVPCGCTGIDVTASCCRTTSTHALPACPSDLVADIACGSCRPVGPCGAWSIAVSGTVACEGGPSRVTVAGCQVEIVGVDASGSVVALANAGTDGAGRYDACLPEPVSGPPIAAVHATARCCGETTSMTVAPDTTEVVLPAMACPGCSPCPDGMTRVQGRVHCAAAGPVAACAVDVVVPTCGGFVTLTLVTDAQGKYSACVPCPCALGSSTLRVVARCCGVEARVDVRGCRPVTPVRTLECPGPCR